MPVYEEEGRRHRMIKSELVDRLAAQNPHLHRGTDCLQLPYLLRHGMEARQGGDAHAAPFTTAGPEGEMPLHLATRPPSCQTFCNKKSDGGRMGITAKRMGRPPGEPSTVVRLPVPVATLAKRLASGTLRAGDINGFLDVAPRQSMTVPLMASPAACGFPSPADDYLDRPLDFNELLIENPAATFAVRIAGDSMTGVGLFPGDIAVVDRARTAADGSIVLALLGGRIHDQALSLQGLAELASGRESGLSGYRAERGLGLRSVGRDHHVDPHAVADSEPGRPRRLQQFLCELRARVSAGVARPSGCRSVEQ